MRALSLIVTLIAGITGLYLHEAIAAGGGYEPQKVVYQNNGRGQDSADYFKALLKNLDNHMEAVGKDRADIKVVNHGNGVALFQQAENDKATAEQIDELCGRGVQFLICNNTLTERKIDWKSLYGVKEDKIVTSGVAELVRLQQRSYNYVHP